MDGMDFYTRADLNAARDDGFSQGRRVEQANAAKSMHRWTAFGATAFLAAVLVFTYIMANDFEAPNYNMVEVYGQTCVQIEHPDYTHDSDLIDPYVVFCERVPAELGE